MKKVIGLIALFIGSFLTIKAQTYCLGYDVVSITATEFTLQLKLQGSSNFKLGSSNFRFNYNSSALSNPTLVAIDPSNSALVIPPYDIINVVQTSPSTARFNILLASPNTGVTIAASSAWTNIGRITFTILDPSGTTSLSYNAAASPVFKDDEATQIFQAMSGCPTLNVTLPIELIAFDAKRAKNTTLLEWTSVNALDMATFDVQRSNDGEHFETIGQVKAINTIDKKGYAFTDAQPLNGVNYYRLKMVETTGKSTYSAIKSIIFGKDLSARVYPSLFQDILTVDVNSSQAKGDVSIQIFDIAGNLMVNKKLNYANGFGQVTMPTGNLTAGVYIVKIIENQATLQTKVTKL